MIIVDPLAAKFPEWSPYNYTMGNPMLYIDPDGRAPNLPPAAIGAGLGFIIQSGSNAISQLMSDQDFNFGEAFKEGTKGAITGGIAGASLGMSLLAQSGIGGLANAGVEATDDLVSGEEFSGKEFRNNLVIGSLTTFGFGKINPAVAKSTDAGSQLKFTNTKKFEKFGSGVYSQVGAAGVGRETGEGAVNQVPLMLQNVQQQVKDETNNPVIFRIDLEADN